MYYYPWLLQQRYADKQQTGTQLLDILRVHCHNALPGSNDDSLTGQPQRNRETRILWDPTFQDPSWYGDIGINGGVLHWIPTLKAMVNQYHPGLQIACTEYNSGDEAKINGATITATSGQSSPAAPTGLIATAGNAQVKLSWTASTGASAYNVYRSAATGTESMTPITTGITGTR
jgi:hypothetical protein